MGMILSLVQFSKLKLEVFLDSPQQFEENLSVLENSEDDPSCYLDKAWEALHYILTGTKMDGYLWTGTNRADNLGPLHMAIYSDQFFDEQDDIVLGPASYLTPEQVSQINAAISKLDSSIVRERYSPEEMNKIGVYANFWSEERDMLEYLTDSFKNLREFYADAASKEHAVASYVS